jgi:AraC-like DNA-binding protein
MLASTFLTIKEIAAKVDAGDESHFVRDFKVAFGCTPSEYRRTMSHYLPAIHANE